MLPKDVRNGVPTENTQCLNTVRSLREKRWILLTLIKNVLKSL